MRPTCCNYGCSKGVTPSSGRVGYPNVRYRPVCSHCQKASCKKHDYAVGVTPFVTGQCSNKDAHLGFKCWTSFDDAPADFKGRTQIDHRDGDPHNNVLENLDELCVACHAYKSQLNGDHNGHRSTSRRFKKVV